MMPRRGLSDDAQDAGIVCCLPARTLRAGRLHHEKIQNSTIQDRNPTKSETTARTVNRSNRRSDSLPHAPGQGVGEPNQG